jgi:hypothetical protein
MGGVDLHDSFVGRAKIRIKSKKWYMRIFYHLLDITVVNSWIIYKKVMKDKCSKLKSLPEFRIELAEVLCRFGQKFSTRQRSTAAKELDKRLESKATKKSAAHIPPKDIRNDGLFHFPEHDPKGKTRTRCKKAGCNKLSSIKCKKCDVYLCLMAHRNCFRDFHS